MWNNKGRILRRRFRTVYYHPGYLHSQGTCHGSATFARNSQRCYKVRVDFTNFNQEFKNKDWNCVAVDRLKCSQFLCRMALNSMYPWQNETNLHLPGGAISVAHQFLRCVLHQLAPNGVFMQMFQTHINGNDFDHKSIFQLKTNLKKIKKQKLKKIKIFFLQNQQECNFSKAWL